MNDDFDPTGRRLPIKADCCSAEQLIKEVFPDSDTDVVSALWGGRGSNRTPIEYAAEARALVAAAGGRHRALIHGGVMPILM